MSFEPDDITHEQRIETVLLDSRALLKEIRDLLKLIANLDLTDSLEDRPDDS